MDTRKYISPPSTSQDASEDADVFNHVDPFGPGDTVSVSLKIKEGDRDRAQAFQGVVIRGKFERGKIPQPGASFTVRRISANIGVERTIPLYSSSIISLKVLRRGKVRRAKLFYLRNISGKKARIKELR